ncbi:hypothetical protein AB3M75_05130 [Serratia ureilytica]|uniref:phage protein n=1 Tax=Serratia ureilytica TaxID=300181 RepID=UPI003712F394
MKQFGRQLRLILGNAQESLTVDALRVTFEISKTLSSEPNPATISVYNLNASHRNALASGQFNRVSLAVGYEALRVIYTGDIIAVQTRRSDVDFLTEMECGDGQQDYTQARVSTTLRAGATDAEILSKTAESMRRTQQGVIDLPKDRTLPRGKVLTGNARDVLHKIARNHDADWSIQDGHLTVLPRDKVLADNEGFVLSQETGMVGSPEKTSDGLKVTCLLNPTLRIGGLVRIRSILPGFDGDYKITELTHAGDLLGDNWYTTVLCIGGQFQKAENKNGQQNTNAS